MADHPLDWLDDPRHVDEPDAAEDEYVASLLARIERERTYARLAEDRLRLRDEA